MLKNCIPYLFCSLFLLLLWSCTEFRDDNVLDVDGTNYHQYPYELTVSADSVIFPEGAAKDTLNKRLGQEIIRDGRAKSYKFWTQNTNWLVLKCKYKNDMIIVGNPQAVNEVNINIGSTRGWLMTNTIAAKETLTVSWWDQPDTLWLADFEIFKSRRNKLGGWIGAWNRYPNDPTQGAHEFDAPGKGYDGGNCLGIKYDVDSHNPAICGIFFKLSPDSNGTIDLSAYKYVNLFLRGDPDSGFTTTLQIELKGQEPPDFYYDWTKQPKLRNNPDSIEAKWKPYTVPFAEFTDWPEHAKLESFEAVHEFTITFADRDVDKNAKTGIIYVDDIFFLDSLPYSRP